MPSTIYISHRLVFVMSNHVIPDLDIILLLQPFFAIFYSPIWLRHQYGECSIENPVASWCGSPPPTTRCIVVHIIKHCNNHRITSFLFNPCIYTPWTISTMAITFITHLVCRFNVELKFFINCVLPHCKPKFLHTRVDAFGFHHKSIFVKQSPLPS
jgi:hypothetical protein